MSLKIFTFSVKINSPRFNKFDNSFDRPGLLLHGYAANVNCQVTVLRLPCASSPTNKPSTILQHSSNNLFAFFGRHGDLMVSALLSDLICVGLSPKQGHCVVFLGRTLLSQYLCSPKCMGTSKLNTLNYSQDGLVTHPGGSRNTPGHFMLQKLG